MPPCSSRRGGGRISKRRGTDLEEEGDGSRRGGGRISRSSVRSEEEGDGSRNLQFRGQAMVGRWGTDFEGDGFRSGGDQMAYVIVVVAGPLSVRESLVLVDDSICAIIYLWFNGQ
jgi:hypothetical protein